LATSIVMSKRPIQKQNQDESYLHSSQNRLLLRSGDEPLGLFRAALPTIGNQAWLPTRKNDLSKGGQKSTGVQ